RRGDRAPRRPVAAREGALDDVAPTGAPELGTRAFVRRRARPRVARADDDGPPSRHPELDHVRLRVRVAPAPARLPRSDEGRRPRLDPSRAPRPLWRGAAEARPVSGPEGGVLPRRLRARPVRHRPVAGRPRAGAGRPAPTAGRLALPPALEPALPADDRLPRPARGRA